jgi:hypothetical protein
MIIQLFQMYRCIPTSLSICSEAEVRDALASWFHALNEQRVAPLPPCGSFATVTGARVTRSKFDERPFHGLSIQARSISNNHSSGTSVPERYNLDSRENAQGAGRARQEEVERGLMERIGKPLAVLALGLAVSAAATPSFAQRSEEMSAVRAQALHECNGQSAKLRQYTWGAHQIHKYRTCMTQRGQME